MLPTPCEDLAVTPRLRLALRWAAGGLAVHLLLAGLFLAKYDGNPQWFVHFGKQGSVMPVAAQVFGRDLLVPHLDGHDGQAYWLLARDPLLLDGRDVVAPNLDRPGYRAQRILYPALAAPWRLAGEQALVWGLLVTNLVVVFLGGLIAALLALEAGAPARASLAFALSPGVIIATIMDGSDALAVAALLAALYALVRGRHGWAVAAATAAVLAKEPTYFGIVAVALLATALPRRVRLGLLVVPAGLAAGWAVYARWRLGWPPSGVQEFASPFWGYLDAYRRGWRPVGNWHDAAVAVALVPFGVLTVRRWWRRPTLLTTAAVPFVALVPFFSAQVLDLLVNTLRAVAPAVTLVWLDLYVPDPGPMPSTARLRLAGLRASHRSR